MDEAETLCDRVAIVDKGKVIALGTPRELIRSLGAEHVVEFAMSEGDAAAGRGRAARAAGRARRAAENATAALIASEMHLAVPALLDALGPIGARKLAFLTTHSATLEDVFVALDGKAPARCLSRA